MWIGILMIDGCELESLWYIDDNIIDGLLLSRPSSRGWCGLMLDNVAQKLCGLMLDDIVQELGGLMLDDFVQELGANWFQSWYMNIHCSSYDDTSNVGISMLNFRLQKWCSLIESQFCVYIQYAFRFILLVLVVLEFFDLLYSYFCWFGWYCFVCCCCYS